MDGATSNLYDIPVPAMVRPAGTQPPWDMHLTYDVPVRPVAKVPPAIANTDASVSYSDLNPTAALDEHWAMLREIRTNSSMWPENAEGPSEGAVGLAAIALKRLDSLGFAPTRVVASAEGGVGVCFVMGDNYADIEFLNTGEILGVTSNRRDRPNVWAVEQNDYSLAKAAIRIRQFFEKSSPAKDAAKRSDA
jgi:hypothetical protein